MSKRKSQIKKRTWKYFLQQKWEEITDTTPYIFVCTFCLGIFLQIFWFNGDIIEVGSTDPMCKTAAIIGLCILGFWAIVGIVLGIKCIIKWLTSNWRLAKKKAEEDFKRRQSG